MDKNKDAQYYLNLARRIPSKEFKLHGKRNVLCSRSLQLSLHNPGPLYDIWGMFLLNSNEYYKSTRKLKKAISISPYKAETWEDLGNAQLALGKDEEGFRCLKIAMSITPSDFLHKALIKALYERGRAQEIPEVYRELVEIIPTKTHRGYFYFAASLVLQDLGLSSIALSFFRIIMGFFPHNASFNLQYAKLLRKEGFIEEAKAAFRKAIYIEPSYSQFSIDVAMLEYNLGNVQEAIEELKTAKKNSLTDKSVIVYIVLMRCHLSGDEIEIEKEKDELIQVLKSGNNFFYKELSEELEAAQLNILNQVDGKTKEFLERKIKALNSVLSWVEKYYQNI